MVALGLAVALTLPAPQNAESPQQDQPIAPLLRVIQAEHIRPPGPADLLAAGIEAAAEDLEPELADWLERIPDRPDDAAVEAFLSELQGAVDVQPLALAIAMATGIARRLPGGLISIDPEMARVNDSVESNQYVGVGVVLEMTGARPVVRDTYFGGPAHRAGILPGDVIYEVDGFDTENMEPTSFFEYARDDEGTELTYVVAQPGEERRIIDVVRAVVPRETVVGNVRGDDEQWRHRIGTSRAGYVALTGIAASTPHELRQAAERMRREGLDAIVLDLRGLYGTHVHAAALVADQFRTEGVLGASATRHRRTEYPAGSEALFDLEDTVVLVDGRTRAVAEWLAAALQHGGARVAGQSTPGVPLLTGRIDVPGWPRQVRIATGWLLDPRADGDQPLRGIEPDRLVADADRAVDAARELLGA